MSKKAKHLWLYFFAGITFAIAFNVIETAKKDPALSEELFHHCVKYPKFHSDCQSTTP